MFFSPLLKSWVVTRHADISAVVAEPARFSSAEAITVGAAKTPPEVITALMDGYPLVPSLVDNDPPAHTRFRSLVSKAFTGRRLAEKEPAIRALVDELINTFVHEGQADLFLRFAHPLSSSIIAEILGIPRADISRFRRWSDDLTTVLAAHGPVEHQVACRARRGRLPALSRLGARGAQGGSSGGPDERHRHRGTGDDAADEHGGAGEPADAGALRRP